MLSAEIENRVIAAIKKNKRIESIPIDLTTTFDELKLESLEIICTVFDLEDAFNITIPDDAATNLRCVRDVVESVSAAIGTATVTPCEGQS